MALIERLREQFASEREAGLAATRRQQARIEELEARLAAIEAQEPVAWMQPDPINKTFYTVHPQSRPTMYAPWTIPLYTNKIG